MKVVCYYEPGSRRSTHIAKAMAAGARACGEDVELTRDWSIDPRGDVAVAYGWACPDLFEAYRVTGRHFVYVDLGWWGRKPVGAELDGYHKVVVDAREPTAYFRRGSPPDRFDHFGKSVEAWNRHGNHILVAGMSAKSAGTRGFEPFEWEMMTIAKIKAITDRPIVYRPKPSWADAHPIPGAAYSPGSEPVEAALADAWAIVTLHSNVAVDALLAGIPISCESGVAAEFSTRIEHIETPSMPRGRKALMADIANCQWSVPEMATGECWKHLKECTPLCA